VKTTEGIFVKILQQTYLWTYIEEVIKFSNSSALVTYKIQKLETSTVEDSTTISPLFTVS